MATRLGGPPYIPVYIQERYKALNDISGGVSKKSIAEKHGVAKNTILTLIKDKKNIFAAYESGKVGPKRNKIIKVNNEDLDKAVFTWFENCRANDVPNSGIH